MESLVLHVRSTLHKIITGALPQSFAAVQSTWRELVCTWVSKGSDIYTAHICDWVCIIPVTIDRSSGTTAEGRFVLGYVLSQSVYSVVV